MKPSLTKRLTRAFDELEEILLTLSPQKLNGIDHETLKEVRKCVVESKKSESVENSSGSIKSATPALLEPPFSELSMAMRKRSAVQFKPRTEND